MSGCTGLWLDNIRLGCGDGRLGYRRRSPRVCCLSRGIYVTRCMSEFGWIICCLYVGYDLSEESTVSLCHLVAWAHAISIVNFYYYVLGDDRTKKLLEKIWNEDSDYFLFPTWTPCKMIGCVYFFRSTNYAAPLARFAVFGSVFCSNPLVCA